MIGSAIGAVVGTAASIFGGIKASQTMDGVRKRLNEQRQKNENWYNRRYNEDPTQTASAQAILSHTEEAIRNRNRQAAGTAAVMGATEESQMAAKAANNQALADAASNIAVNAEARKERIEQQYMDTDNSIIGQLNNLDVQKAQAISEAAKGVAGAAGSLGNMGK